MSTEREALLQIRAKQDGIISLSPHLSFVFSPIRRRFKADLIGAKRDGIASPSPHPSSAFSPISMPIQSKSNKTFTVVQSIHVPGQNSPLQDLLMDLFGGGGS